MGYYEILVHGYELFLIVFNKQEKQPNQSDT